MVFLSDCNRFFSRRRSPSKTTLQIFEKKWSNQMMKKGAGFWYSVESTDETRVKLTNDGIVRVFRRKNTRCHEKNVRNASTDQRSIMYWGAIRSDGRKKLVKCPNTLNSIIYLVILICYDEKMLFIFEVWCCNKTSHLFIRHQL